MNTLAVVAYSKRAVDLYFDILHNILKDNVEIKKYYISNGELKSKIEADLVVVSANDIYKITKKYLPENSRIVIANLTISKEGFQKITNLPKGTKALLVNVNLNLSLDCIEQIYQLCANNIELIPYSPYMELLNDVDTAITPGEKWFVPSTIKKIVDIGERIIDISTIVYVLMYFGLEDLFNTKAVKEYSSLIMPVNFCTSLNTIENYADLNEFLFIDNKIGVISFTYEGVIINYNNIAMKMIGQTGEKVVGENILSLFSQDSIKTALINMKPMQKKKFTINRKEFLIKISIEDVHIKRIGYLTIEQVYETKLKDWAIGKGYTARYKFDDIITKSEKMNKMKELARINANTESSILITGESGTGKELFAQAIHNASSRRDRPFVAINCASLPETLLESELFGYDEGAFTGALRGGKKGIFELANTGTLFLDEIGEMPIHLQARLLRVLQEKEIMRIGGDCVIDIDVRIIAATNININTQIKNGTFRADLYYRLNVIPIKLIPLRERVIDIPLLIENFKELLNADFIMTKEAMNQMMSYEWKGNIRELRNYVEYFRNLQKPIIDIDDLSFYSEDDYQIQLSNEEMDILRNFVNNTEFKTSQIITVMNQMKIMMDNNQTIGRRSLSENPYIKAMNLSETKVRNIIEGLEDYNFVEINKGRAGTLITSQGLKILYALKNYLP